MTPRERILEQATELVRKAWPDVRQRAQRESRRGRRLLLKLLRTVAWLALSTFMIIVGMISAGWLLGPRGYEGLLVTPLLLLATWAAILYWSFKPRPAPRLVVSANLAQLPADTEEWLDQQRRTLPAAAQPKVDSLAQRLEELTPQLSRLQGETPAAVEARRLIGEELPELIRGYQKVPRALKHQPLYGGHTPDRQLLEGLTTIDEEIARLHERLAADDLHALATQQRYLEIKYKRDKAE